MEILGILEDLEWERSVESSELNSFVGVNRIRRKYSVESQSFSSLSRDLCKLKVTSLRFGVNCSLIVAKFWLFHAVCFSVSVLF